MSKRNSEDLTRRAVLLGRIRAYEEIGRGLSQAEKDHMRNDKDEVRSIELRLGMKQSYPVKSGPDYRVDMSKVNKRQQYGKKAVRGLPNETLSPKQSLTDYAYASGYIPESRNVPKSFDWDAYWGQQVRMIKPGAELRHDPFEARAAAGMGEDITAGGAAVVATIWSVQIMDLIRAKLFLHNFNVTTLPLKSELTNYPVWTSDIAPSYIANDSSGTALSLDLTPSVGSLQFNCAGAFADITTASMALIEDAVTTGGVDGLIRNAIAKKYARLIESVAMYGQTGSTGNPGLVNEVAGYVSGSPGIMSQSMGTNGAAPTTYADISKAAAQVRNQSVEPNGLVWHPGTMAEYAQLQDTLHQPLRPTPDVADLVKNAQDTSQLNYQSETQGSSNSASSLYLGDWSYMFLGMRLNGVEVTPVPQRYVEYMEFGWLSRMRFSVRTFWPNKAFVRLQGLL